MKHIKFLLPITLCFLLASCVPLEDVRIGDLDSFTISMKEEKTKLTKADTCKILVNGTLTDEYGECGIYAEIDKKDESGEYKRCIITSIVTPTADDYTDLGEYSYYSVGKSEFNDIQRDFIMNFREAGIYKIEIFIMGYRDYNVDYFVEDFELTVTE